MDAQSLPVSVPRGLPLESPPLEPLLAQVFDRRPDLAYERLRHRYGQVAPVEPAGVPAWLVLGHDEVRGVLQDEDELIEAFTSRAPDRLGGPAFPTSRHPR